MALKCKRVIAAACCVASLILLGCSGDRWHSVEGAAWGTTYHIKWRGGTPGAADSLLAVLERVDASLSMFREGSLVGRINAGDTSVRADTLLRRVIAEARLVNRLSGGMFDPTVGPLMEAWGFGRNAGRPMAAAPEADTLARLLEAVGMQGVDVDAEGRVTRHSAATRLDFSAIAKGFGCDLLGEALEGCGVTDYMVEVGGEIAARGLNPRGKPWRIAIDSPEGEGVADQVLEVADGAVATSGNYRNFRDLPGGQRVGHTMNPLTGRPAEGRVLSATVVAPCCLRADALATACMAMQPDSALAMIEALDGVEALLIMPDMKVRRTPGFRAAGGR